MAILVECPKCHRKTQVPNTMAGMSSACPVCGEVATVPGQRKICVACGRDVAGMKRNKDAAGNYYCLPCWQKVYPDLVAAQTAAAEVAGLLDFADDNPPAEAAADASSPATGPAGGRRITRRASGRSVVDDAGAPSPGSTGTWTWPAARPPVNRLDALGPSNDAAVPPQTTAATAIAPPPPNLQSRQSQFPPPSTVAPDNDLRSLADAARGAAVADPDAGLASVFASADTASSALPAADDVALDAVASIVPGPSASDIVYCARCGRAMSRKTPACPACGTPVASDSASMAATTTRLCPYCGESISAKAIKCRFCGEMVDGTRNGEKATHIATRRPVGVHEQRLVIAGALVMLAALIAGAVMLAASGRLRAPRVAGGNVQIPANAPSAGVVSAATPAEPNANDRSSEPAAPGAASAAGSSAEAAPSPGTLQTPDSPPPLAPLP